MDNWHRQPRPYGGGRGHPTPHNAQPHFRPPSTWHGQYHPQQQQVFPSWRELLEKADWAVARARQEMLANGESVSAWQVSQAALLTLQVGPSSALAQQIQQLPSLQALVAIEAKINAFIHCFVAVRGMTTLYDLESAICKSEGIERFEDLEMGPFLQHPLVRHYFSLNGDVSEVLKISSEEIISYLNAYLIKMKGNRVVVEEFLDFLAKRKSVTAKEKLGVRIRSLGLHVSFIREARKSEHASFSKSQQKKQLGENSESTEVPLADHLSTPGEDIPGGNFSDSSSDDEDGEDSSNEVERDDKEENFTKLKGKVRISHPDGTPLLLKWGAENLSCTDWLRQDIKDRDGILTNNANYTKKGRRRKTAKLVMETSALRIFIKNWKETCRKHTPVEVLNFMLEKYLSSHKRRVKVGNTFSVHPGLGLLNVALASIKCGMLDDLYDTIGKESLGQITRLEKFDSQNSSPTKKDASAISESPMECAKSVTVELIIDKISENLSIHDEPMSNERSILQKRLIFLKKLCNCGSWVAECFCVPEFKTLGYGEFFEFLEAHASLLPTELQSFLMGKISPKSNFEVCMLPNELEVLFSQALSSSWDGENVTEEMFSTLLANQFPFLSLRVRDGSLEDLLGNVGESRSNAIYKCVLFSQTLVQTSLGEQMPSEEDNLLEIAPTGGKIREKAQISASNLYQDALEAVLSAPVLSDINSWTHWDCRFAPYLGPLVRWLLNEVNTSDLLCLVTRDGKVIRVDNSATLDSFLQCALKGSPFQMAVQLLSLFASLGGEKHVPLSLLKCHAGRAFDVMLKNLTDSEAIKDIASKYFLECVSYLPTEFRQFAADVLLSGLKSVIKDAPSVILSKCELLDKRVMLHEIGLSLGTMEWIDDFHLFCSTANNKTFIPSTSEDEQDDTLTNAQNEVEASIPRERKKNTAFAGEIWGTQCSENSPVTFDGEVGNAKTLEQDEESRHKDASLVIDSIRREEFGLDPGLSAMERSLLKKQHARLGRALHCLSQELYSQDSHFLLELIQNADDNSYPEHVEPTLVFILQEMGVTILNNEYGFSAPNIRALCDVGNSTKKGINTGYIGKKGIGFKSVFRVTDAPEIHSNGFHLKFDVSEGQIGFLLPTMIPPCDIKALCKMAPLDSDHSECDRWNTCIVLPFKNKLLEGTSRNDAITMFSDLHPSLLLFLHRLQCIKFRNMLNDSLTIMRKEVLRNGITKVSHGKVEMNWFVVTQKLQADIIQRNVQATEIALAFPLQELEDEKYSPLLDHQPVFAFLPLRTYGLKFILQGDFILPSSREEVDGDDPWNQWLLSEFPKFFVNVQRSFCSLPCFEGNLGKAVTAYMSYVPLLGEVHGFFSSLPRMIISNLRRSDCLLIERDNNTWVPPCKVVRGWNEDARNLLPDKLLQEHLGLGLLDKDITICDPLSRALGIEEYGPKILLQVLTGLCHKKDGLQSMGLAWLSAWLTAFYTMSFHSTGVDLDYVEALRKLPFIPLSNGTFGSVKEGTIWLQSDVVNLGFNGEVSIDAFPNLCSKLRTVNQAFLDEFDKDVNTKMLLRLGVQKLSSHEITKLHVLPAVSDHGIASRDKALMVECLCFLAVHLESLCSTCLVERENLVSEFRNKAFVLTNYGYKRSAEIPIHFSKKFGSSIDLSKFFEQIDMEWHEVDHIYLKHPTTKSLPNGEKKWKFFFHELGVTEFVQVVQVEKRISDLPDVLFKNAICNKDVLFLESVAKDWESPELDQLLSLLSTEGNCSTCKFVLGVLDKLWDNYYNDKTKGYCHGKSSGDSISFSSSFVNSVCRVRWVVSSMDGELHYPRDLFYDCDAVRLILGPSAPYAVPKVKSANLLHAIGFKTTVTLEDIVGIFKVWTKSKAPFKSSIAQMSRLYSFLWKEMNNSKQKMMCELLSEPFIFIPFSLSSDKEAIMEGSFKSPKEVCWNDSTGALDQIKEMNPCGVPKCLSDGLLCKTLCEVYPGLHDFFVSQCGVHEIPSFRDYFQILQNLSTASADPSEGAKIVFRILIKLADAVKSGEVSNEDTSYIKENLTKLEFRVLPTINKKWVSLHQSFGLVSWPDDENLIKEFKLLHKIELLHFGELSDDEEELFHLKMPILMKTLRIPAFSEVLTREAIYYGLVDSTSEASLVDWSLPYAQRYIHHRHPEIYDQLRKSEFSDVRRLLVVVVETLFYRYVVRNLGIESDKRSEISTLLQGNKLFVTRECDSHAIFMELSRLFFNGTPELHLANFLHMILTMIESGSTESQVEMFIVNSQRMPQLRLGEPVWCLSPASSFDEDDGSTITSLSSLKMKRRTPFVAKRKAAGEPSLNWPPSNWTNESGSGFISLGSSAKMTKVDDSDNLVIDKVSEVEISADAITDIVSEVPELRLFSSDEGYELNTCMPVEDVAVQIGRRGEFIAFRHFCEKYGEKSVKWVNEDSETGLPYDITVSAEGREGFEYIEVKATQSVDKDWFSISAREWEFAAHKGKSFSIAHVILVENSPRIRMFRDPVELCRSRKLQLAILMPKEQQQGQGRVSLA